MMTLLLLYYYDCIIIQSIKMFQQRYLTTTGGYIAYIRQRNANKSCQIGD